MTEAKQADLGYARDYLFHRVKRYYLTADWQALLRRIAAATDDQIKEARKYSVPPLIDAALTGTPKTLTKEKADDQDD